MSRIRLLRAGLGASLLAPLVLLSGCNGDDSGPSETPVTIEKAPSKSGDAQVGVVGEALASPLQVLITRDGVPVEGTEVQWTAGNDGSMSPSTSESDADGLAQTTWTLGPETGSQSASARVTGVPGSVSFTATAEETDVPTAATVTVTDNQFTPRNVTILVGQAVTWEWGTNANAHNVSPADGTDPTRSGNVVAEREPYSFIFTAPGTYTYYCEAHGTSSGSGMAGTVTVLAEAP